MRILLETSGKRFLFAAFVFVVGAGFVFVAGRLYAASRASESPSQPQGLQRANELDPWSAEYHARLGRYLFYSSQQPEPAAVSYRRAIQLNPHVAQYWLDLASASIVLGDSAGYREAVLRATETDPANPAVAWTAANFYLVNGDVDAALRNFRIVVQYDPEMTNQAFQVCWSATHNASRILETVVPDDPERIIGWIKFLMLQNEADGAARAWTKLVGLGRPFTMQSAFPYIDFLNNRHDTQMARSVWRTLLELNGATPADESQNLITNADFDKPVLNGGFDWRYHEDPAVTLGLDSTQTRSGSRSLKVTFNGSSPDDAGIQQFIAVMPNTEYVFSAYVRSEAIISASGPRIAIQDAYSDNTYVLSNDMEGSHPWTEIKGDFTTGSATNLLKLRIVRNPSSPKIQGSLWVDDFRLTPKKPATTAEVMH